MDIAVSLQAFSYYRPEDDRIHIKATVQICINAIYIWSENQFLRYVSRRNIYSAAEYILF